MPILDELDRLQKEVDAAKKNAAVFEGRLQESMKRLKDDFGIESIEDATREADILQEEIKTLENDVQTRLTLLRETYSW